MVSVHTRLTEGTTLSYTYRIFYSNDGDFVVATRNV